MAKHFISVESPDGRDIYMYEAFDIDRLGYVFTKIEIGDDAHETFFVTALDRASNCFKSAKRYLDDPKSALNNIGHMLIADAIGYAEVAHNYAAYSA